MTDQVDVACVGGGLGGLAGAIRAHDLGLEALVVERSPFVGGMAAYSGGWVWVGDNHLAAAAGIEDDPDAVAAYLDAVQGERPVDRGSLHVRRAGTGDQPLLVLQSAPGSSEPLVMRGLAPGRTVIAPDFPGNGSSPARDGGPVDIAMIATACAELMGALGHDRYLVWAPTPVRSSGSSWPCAIPTASDGWSPRPRPSSTARRRARSSPGTSRRWCPTRGGCTSSRPGTCVGHVPVLALVPSGARRRPSARRATRRAPGRLDDRAAAERRDV